MYAKFAVFFLAALAAATPEPAVILRRSYVGGDSASGSGCGNGQVQACCNSDGAGILSGIAQCVQVPVIAAAIGECAAGNVAACCANNGQQGLIDVGTCAPLLDL